MLATCIVTSTQHPSGCCSSAVKVASISLNLPRTVVIIMCLTENSTLEWAGSSRQVEVPVCVALLPMGPPVVGRRTMERRGRRVGERGHGRTHRRTGAQAHRRTGEQAHRREKTEGSRGDPLASPYVACSPARLRSCPAPCAPVRLCARPPYSGNRNNSLSLLAVLFGSTWAKIASCWPS